MWIRLRLKGVLVATTTSRRNNAATLVSMRAFLQLRFRCVRLCNATALFLIAFARRPEI